MGKKKEAALKEKRRFSNKQLAILSTILVSIIVLGSVFSFLLLQKPNKFSLNAAIIDQLGKEFPNPQFVDNVTDILTAAGFNVTYHESNELNVTFFKGLAKYNYGIIILRVHSALRDDNSTVDLFTTEPFDEYAHVEDQKNKLLVMGILNYSRDQKEYFAITSKFIESLEGTFPKSIVIAMGCWSLKSGCEQMAKAFINKGAKAYIGWTDVVLPKHTDNETIILLNMLLNNDYPLGFAVSKTRRYTYSSDGQTVTTQLHFYPASTDIYNLKISDMIAEVKASLNNQSAMALFEPILTVCIYRVTPKIKRISNLAYVKLAC